MIYSPNSVISQVPVDGQSDKKGTIQFWFKPSEIYNPQIDCFLYSICSNIFDGYLGIGLSNKKVFIELTDDNAKAHQLLTSNLEIYPSRWNFLSLSFTYKEDENNKTLCEYSLNLNGDTKIYKSEDKDFTVSFTSKSQDGWYLDYRFGHFYNSHYDKEDFYFDGGITLICINHINYRFR